MRIADNRVYIETEDNISMSLETLSNIIDKRRMELYEDEVEFGSCIYDDLDIYSLATYIEDALLEFFQVKKKYIEK